MFSKTPNEIYRGKSIEDVVSNLQKEKLIMELTSSPDIHIFRSMDAFTHLPVQDEGGIVYAGDSAEAVGLKLKKNRAKKKRLWFFGRQRQKRKRIIGFTGRFLFRVKPSYYQDE